MIGSKAAHATLKAAGEALAELRVPVQVIVGDHDSDFADPRAEAEAIVARMPSGIGRVAAVAGAGHYPHAEDPQATADAILGFLAEQDRA